MHYDVHQEQGIFVRMAMSRDLPAESHDFFGRIEQFGLLNPAERPDLACRAWRDCCGLEPAELFLDQRQHFIAIEVYGKKYRHVVGPIALAEELLHPGNG